MKLSTRFQVVKALMFKPKIKLDIRNLSEEEKQKIQDAFKLYDMNQDNHIDRAELADVMGHFLDGQTPTKTQLDNIFNKVDLNHDGEISYDEFEKMMAFRDAQQDAYHKIFDQYDADGDGFLSREELIQVLGKKKLQQIHEAEISEKDVDDIIQLADLDKNGKIDYKEFTKFFI